MFQFLQNWENIVPILLVGVPLINSEVTTGHLFVFFCVCVPLVILGSHSLSMEHDFPEEYFSQQKLCFVYFFNTVIFIEQNFYFIEMLFYLFLKPFLGFLFFSLLIKKVTSITHSFPQPLANITFLDFLFFLRICLLWCGYLYSISWF